MRYAMTLAALLLFCLPLSAEDVTITIDGSTYRLEGELTAVPVEDDEEPPPDNGEEPPPPNGDNGEEPPNGDDNGEEPPDRRRNAGDNNPISVVWKDEGVTVHYPAYDDYEPPCDGEMDGVIGFVCPVEE